MTVTDQETRPRHRGATGITGKYLSLTSHRRDGSPVSTPVWFVEEGGRVFVMTAADSYKVKRLRRNPAALIAPCTARGVPKGEAIPARVEFLPTDERGQVDRLMAEKYRVDRVFVLPLYRLAMKLRGKPAGRTTDTAYLAITPT